MSSRRETLGLRPNQWYQFDDESRHFYLIRSLVGSSIEFHEISGNRMTGTLAKTVRDQLYFVSTTIRDQITKEIGYFGEYVLDLHDIKRWRLVEYRPKDRQQNNRPTTSTPTEPKPSRYIIPPAREDDPCDPFVNNPDQEPDDPSDVESIDIDIDDEPIEVKTDRLSLEASNDIKYYSRVPTDITIDELTKSIMSAQTAGLALFGSDISREGDIELIALGTAQAIYVFNAHNRDLVNKVVKPLLESTRLQKVMYGLRHESDALHHLLGISLEHAFDIRLMYHMVEKKMFTDGVIGRRNVDQLVPYERVVLKFFNLKLPSLDLQMNYRDMSVRVKNVIRLKTIFLRDLFALIHNLMLEEFYNVNRRCLHSLRASEGLEYLVMRADDRELELIENEPTEWELQQIPVLAIPEMRPSTSDTPKAKLVNNGYTILKTKENNNSDETLNSVESR